MNTNVIPMNRPVNDMDVMVNLCNTPRQQQRRQAKRIKQRIRMMALHASLVSAGAALGLLVGIVAF